MHVIPVTLLMFLTCYTVDGLTCLQCNGVPQPRFCSRVVNCYDGEYCSGVRARNEFGEHVFNLGCHSKKVCDNFTSTDKSCSECCGSNLCNANLCGEPGYPTDRGPICFNCPVHTSSGPCHDIDFCLEDEACSVEGKHIFSSEVLTSKCVSKHVCKENPENHVSIVGKRDVSMARRTQPHTCDLCCNHDLCNRNCSTAISGFDIVDCTAHPCGSSGTCYDGDNGYTCVCALGYSGQKCEIDIDDCIPGLCGSHGTCVDGVNNYTCVCHAGFTGINCLTNIDDCTTQPCGSSGTCYDGDNGYTCVCALGYSGRNCEIDTDDCIPGLCGSDGTCVDGVNSYTCLCQAGLTGTNCQTSIPGDLTDCYDARIQDHVTQDGVYNITTWKTRRQIQVFCDMTTEGGGWTVFQNRYDGSVNFYRTFAEYENGFGDLKTEFWLGLKYIQEMANQGKTELRIDLQAENGTRGFETFSNFSLYNNTQYRLLVGPTSFSSKISDDRFRQYHNGQSFSTYDRDLNNCAVNYKGAWWYNNCHNANLNGQYLAPGTENDWTGMVYDSFIYGESLKSSKMMFRRFI